MIKFIMLHVRNSNKLKYQISKNLAMFLLKQFILQTNFLNEIDQFLLLLKPSETDKEKSEGNKQIGGKFEDYQLSFKRKKKYTDYLLLKCICCHSVLVNFHNQYDL